MAILSGLMLASKFSGIGGILLKQWKLVLIVVLVAGIGYYHWDRTRTINNLRADIVTLEQNIANCKGAIGSQNSIIDKSSSAATEVITTEKEATQLAIEAEQAKTKAAIEALNNQQVAATCDAAVKEMIDKARGELKWPE